MEMYRKLALKMKGVSDLAKFLLRITLAYGFYGPVKMKWLGIDNVASWFEGMGFPLPTFNAYMAAGTEALGVLLLALGLGTRLISLPLMVIMLVAIFTVHWSNGFEAGSNGLEIPLYYLIMLFSILAFGPGKWSLDHLLKLDK